MMSKVNVKTTQELEDENVDLQADNINLRASHDDLQVRIEKMEQLIAGQKDEDTYVGPEPVMHYDPYDSVQNPNTILKHPEGKWLSWKNPNIRQRKSWEGWKQVCYDDEIGQNLDTYLVAPPAKFEGTASQDNYVRRGTDSVLCWLPLEYWLARQDKRESKALRNERVASNTGNRTIQEGVSTYGDGAQQENAPPGGFKGRTPQVPDGPLRKRTEMFSKE